MTTCSRHSCRSVTLERFRSSWKTTWSETRFNPLLRWSLHFSCWANSVSISTLWGCKSGLISLWCVLSCRRAAWRHLMFQKQNDWMCSFGWTAPLRAVGHFLFVDLWASVASHSPLWPCQISGRLLSAALCRDLWTFLWTTSRFYRPVWSTSGTLGRQMRWAADRRVTSCIRVTVRMTCVSADRDDWADESLTLK